LGVDPALIQEFPTLSSHEKLLAGVAVVTVVSIAVEECGKPNAIYIPNELRVLMCAEHAQWLRYLPLPQ
jgi:hypothetical protein